ncbi:UbiA family prenyltransferase [Paraburkholderia jirisanensis]
MSTLGLNQRFYAMLALCRVSNLPTVWSNVLTAAVLSDLPGNTQNITGALLLCFALSCFYCGGMGLNDLCDLEHDRVHQRYRPIPAGRITLAHARVVTFALFGLALFSLLVTPHRAGLAAGVALFAVIWLYDRFHKAHPSTVLAMASARLLVYVVTALALCGGVPAQVWLAGAVQAGYVLVLTLVARYEGKTAARRYAWPVIPWMLAAIALLDGAVLAVLVNPVWLLAGVAGTALTRAAQRYVRGD